MRWAVVAALALAGCSKPERYEAESYRFAPGSEVLTYSPDSDTVAVMDLPAGRGVMPGTSWDKFNVMPRGIKVRVISDEEMSDKPEVRKVRVLILEGDFRMVEASFWRSQLRPTPPP